jgi:hypothetical protein
MTSNFLSLPSQTTCLRVRATILTISLQGPKTFGSFWALSSGLGLRTNRPVESMDADGFAGASSSTSDVATGCAIFTPIGRQRTIRQP